MWSHSDHTYSLYEPWTPIAELIPSMSADIGGGEGSDSNMGSITVAVMDIHLDKLLQQALAREHCTVEDDSDGEGSDVDPLPYMFVTPTSPLTILPTSPESTLEFKPTER